MKTTRQRSTALVALTLSVAAVVALSGCSSTSTGSSSSTSADKYDKKLPASLVKAAKAEAKAAAGGKKIGGTLTVLGVNSGAEANELLAAMEPFEDATGVTIKYTGTADQATVLAAGVRSNNAPEIVDAQGSGLLVQYAKAGKVIPLDDVVDTAAVKKDYSKTLIEGASVGGKMYGIWGESDTFQVWYNTKSYTGPKTGTYSQLMDWATESAAKDSSNAPFCMGLNSGAASGWPAEAWIESVFLGKYGPKELAKWADGKLPWTSPEVKWAFQQFGKVATSNSLVQGGPQSAVSTSFVQYSKGMFASPQTCQLTLWGNYAAGLAQGIYPDVKVPADMNFFPVPASNPTYAKDIATNGQVMFATKSTPASTAFMKYWASAQAQSLVAAGGSWTVGNRSVPLSVYPNAAMKQSAQLLQSSSSVVPGPSAVASSATTTAYEKGIVSYVQNPSDLDSILQTIQSATK